jgi:hypothetical protein
MAIWTCGTKKSGTNLSTLKIAEKIATAFGFGARKLCCMVLDHSIACGSSSSHIIFPHITRTSATQAVNHCYSAKGGTTIVKRSNKESSKRHSHFILKRATAVFAGNSAPERLGELGSQAILHGSSRI